MDPDPPRDPEATPPTLGSTHTAGFPALLRRLGVALMITTYQAGKVVIVRARGDRLNTHFRTFEGPMGLALSGDRLAIGTRRQIWEFYDLPAAGEGGGPSEARFLPRSFHVTGNVQVHEMAWAGDELWFVNTRFSCLCTLDRRHSFTPRWRPPFISALAPEDRCHLNGFCLVDGRPRYASALGDADVAGGWRATKAGGGVLLDVSTGEVVARGLSMPHSPRWHEGKLWLLESGTGTLGVVEPGSGRFEPVVALPGFARGLDFLGPLAFVGLSKARETAIFGGLPVTTRPQELTCGVCAIDTRTGRPAAALKFDDSVREIFAVLVLPDRPYPDLIVEDRALLADTFALEARAVAEVPSRLPPPNAEAPRPNRNPG